MLGEKQVSFIVADDQATKYRSENAANVGTSHFTQKKLEVEISSNWKPPETTTLARPDFGGGTGGKYLREVQTSCPCTAC
jgi:hypothetical protein